MMMDKSCMDFVQVLSSAAPVPGGGGASAFTGAIGVALGSMVANLTLGKKKYEAVQEDIKTILEEAAALQRDLLALVEKDAEVFEPLSKAYGLPRNTDEERKKRDEIMEAALKAACSVPLEIMVKSFEAIKLHEELAVKGTRIAISDVGVGVAFCKAALMGASLNVFINTKLMKDRGYAESINRKTEAILKDSLGRADKVYGEVEQAIRS